MKTSAKKVAHHAIVARDVSQRGRLLCTALTRLPALMRMCHPAISKRAKLLQSLTAIQGILVIILQSKGRQRESSQYIALLRYIIVQQMSGCCRGWTTTPPRARPLAHAACMCHCQSTLLPIPLAHAVRACRCHMPAAPPTYARCVRGCCERIAPTGCMVCNPCALHAPPFRPHPPARSARLSAVRAW